MEEKELELRMYFFVNYQLMGIQKGIQCGHAALEYSVKYGSEEQYIRFIRKWKTWIILDGGTTNTHRDFNGVVMGTLDQIGDSLLENDIKFAYFQEPDLNDALTAVCFLADERVWDRENYPDFVQHLININTGGVTSQRIVELRMTPYEQLVETYSTFYKSWTVMIGGKKNVFLRDLIRDKRLA